MHSLGHFEKYSLVHISLILHLAQGSADGGGGGGSHQENTVWIMKNMLIIMGVSCV